jgi:predicted GNAT family acetyltransferase
MGERLVDNAAELRYEWWDGDARVGSVAYRVEPGTRVLIHTEVEPRFEGTGYAGRLVRAALDDLRDRGLYVVPLCPFVAAYVRRHPEYADLVVGDPALSD